MSREQAEKRIAAQMPMEEKRKLAHDEIDCSGSLDHTKSQVMKLVKQFKRMAGSRAE